MTAQTDFPLLGEPLALDLVNTRVRRNGMPLDLLATPAALTRWLRAERQRVTWSGAATRADLDAVQALREAIAQLLQAQRERGRPPVAALDQVNLVLAGATPQPRLTWTASGPGLKPAPASSRRGTLLRALALNAVALLTGPKAASVRTCAHPDCVLQFVAHNPRRRWCSSSTCGNRARVASHYLRQHEAR